MKADHLSLLQFTANYYTQHPELNRLQNNFVFYSEVDKTYMAYSSEKQGFRLACDINSEPIAVYYSIDFRVEQPVV